MKTAKLAGQKILFSKNEMNFWPRHKTKISLVNPNEIGEKSIISQFWTNFPFQSCCAGDQEALRLLSGPCGCAEIEKIKTFQNS